MLSIYFWVTNTLYHEEETVSSLKKDWNRRHRNTILMASYFVRTKVRCLHDGVTNNLRSRVAFLRQSEASGIVRIVFVRWNTPDGTDDFTRYMRWKHDGKRWPYDGHAKGKMNTRMHHEGEHSCSLPAFFWHAKDFVITHEVAAEAQEHWKKVIR